MAWSSTVECQLTMSPSAALSQVGGEGRGVASGHEKHPGGLINHRLQGVWGMGGTIYFT